jgi:cytochrome c-type biogenesis protein CcmH
LRKSTIVAVALTLSPLLLAAIAPPEQTATKRTHKLALVSAAWAVEPDEVLPDAALEQRARELSRGLRCLVCQNQSIDDSNAPLARDLRLLVRERLVEGDSDQAVLDYVVARYGRYVLMRPPFDAATALLWLAPMGVILGGGAFAMWAIRCRSGARAAEVLVAETLTPEEQVRLASVLASDPESDVNRADVPLTPQR